MVPLIATKAELDLVKASIDAMAEAVARETGTKVAYQSAFRHRCRGRRCAPPRSPRLRNSLRHQRPDPDRLRISRDDAASFLGTYMARGFSRGDPFVSIDREAWANCGSAASSAVGHRRRAQGRDLRRARRRPRLVASQRDCARLRLVLAVPRSHRTPRRRQAALGKARRAGVACVGWATCARIAELKIASEPLSFESPIGDEEDSTSATSSRKRDPADRRRHPVEPACRSRPTGTLWELIARFLRQATSTFAERPGAGLEPA